MFTGLEKIREIAAYGEETPFGRSVLNIITVVIIRQRVGLNAGSAEFHLSLRGSKSRGNPSSP